MDIPVIAPIFFDQTPFFYMAILLAVGAWFFLERTSLGIKVRSTWENPRATETQEVNVTLVILLAMSLTVNKKLNAPEMLGEPYKRGER